MKKFFLIIILFISFTITMTNVNAQEGWVNDDKDTYFFQNNEKLTGLQTIDNKTYYFAEDGKLKTGFVDIGNDTYFFSRIYKYALTGWVENAEGTWYQEEDGKLLKGIHKIDEKVYYFGSDGKIKTGFIDEGEDTYFFSRIYKYALTGWVENAEGTWYQEEDGKLLKGIHKIDEKVYYFGSDGKIKTGFIDEGEDTYFFSRIYKYALTGWVTNAEGTWYQEEDGKLLKGIHKIDEKVYCFGSDGKIKTGFIDEGEDTYFFSRIYKYALTGWVTNAEGTWYQEENGKLLKGPQTIDNIDYFFGANGKIEPGIHKIDGKYYYYDTDGKLKTGFVNIGEDTYFFSRIYKYALTGWVENAEGTWYQEEDGKLLKGIHKIDDKKYYFGKDGKIETGFKTVGNDTYFFSRVYKYALTGLKLIDGHNYFINDEGVIQTGFIDIGSDRYFFSRIYKYALTGWVTNAEGTWYQDETGKLLKGLNNIDARDYMFNETTGLLEGFKYIDGQMYYNNPDGSLAKGIQFMAGKYWKFNEITGAFEKIVRQIRVIDISVHNGDINWNQVKESGLVDAVILRLGYGSYSIDTRFETNRSELERLGIPYSIYLFSYAQRADQASEEANFVINSVRDRNIKISTNIFGIYYDLEHWRISSTGETSDTISKDEYKRIITTFVDKVESNLCIKARVYASKNYIEERFPNDVQQYATWVAQWSNNITYQGPYEGWQFTSKADIPGIPWGTDENGNYGPHTDMSIFYY